jgi:hypothetical protein
MTTTPDHSNPVGQRLHRVTYVFQAMARKDKVEKLIVNIPQSLHVASRRVINGDVIDQRK